MSTVYKERKSRRRYKPSLPLEEAIEDSGATRVNYSAFIETWGSKFLLSQRVPIPVVSEYLGHSNSSITLKVYAHMINDEDGLAGNAMDNVLGESL